MPVAVSCEDADALSDAQSDIQGGANRYGRIESGVNVGDRLMTEKFNVLDDAVEALVVAVAVPMDAQMLRPHAKEGEIGRTTRDLDGLTAFKAATQGAIAARLYRTLENVHSRIAHELGDKNISGTLIDIGRGAELFNLTLIENDDAARERHCFDLIVRDVDHGHARPSDAGRASSPRIWTRSAASRFESGSSKRKIFGWRTMTRPMATRCVGRPTGPWVFAARDLVISSDRRARSTRAAIQGRAAYAASQPEGHVLATVICGYRA